MRANVLRTGERVPEEEALSVRNLCLIRPHRPDWEFLAFPPYAINAVHLSRSPCSMPSTSIVRRIIYVGRRACSINFSRHYLFYHWNKCITHLFFANIITIRPCLTIIAPFSPPLNIHQKWLPVCSFLSTRKQEKMVDRIVCKKASTQIWIRKYNFEGQAFSPLKGCPSKAWRAGLQSREGSPIKGVEGRPPNWTAISSSL